MFIAPDNKNEGIEEIRDFIQKNGFEILEEIRKLKGHYQATRNKLVAPRIPHF